MKTPENQENILKYIELVKIIRSNKSKIEKDLAFEEVIKMMEPKLQQFIRKFTIPGHDRDDIYQEAVFALKYKAIKDYDSSRSEIKDISPFDKFAMICIRRHLSTQLKASYQYKNRALNYSMSLNQDRNTGSENDLFLADILVEPNSEQNMIQQLNEKEYQKTLINKLFSKLSVSEKKVFVLYSQKLSYSEMAEKLLQISTDEEKKSMLKKYAEQEVIKLCKSKAKKNKEKRDYYISRLEKGQTLEKLSNHFISELCEEEKKIILLEKIIKSIDNSLSRIKQKSKLIMEKYDKDD